MPLLLLIALPLHLLMLVTVMAGGDKPPVDVYNHARTRVQALGYRVRAPKPILRLPNSVYPQPSLCFLPPALSALAEAAEQELASRPVSRRGKHLMGPFNGSSTTLTNLFRVGTGVLCVDAPCASSTPFSCCSRLSHQTIQMAAGLSDKFGRGGFRFADWSLTFPHGIFSPNEFHITVLLL